MTTELRENEVREAATGKAAIIGRIEVVECADENYKTDLGLLVVFDSPEAIRKALADGECRFTFKPNTEAKPTREAGSA